jgi:O-antigen biosynthesis protein
MSKLLSIIKTTASKYLGVRDYQRLRHLNKLLTGDPSVDSIPEISPINPRLVSTNELRINLVLPSINKNHIFGGITTALAFFDQILPYFKEARLIVVSSKPSKGDLENFRNFKLVKLSDDSGPSRQIVVTYDTTESLAVGSKDIFIATAWFTAFNVQHIIAWQKEMFNFKKSNQFIYFIQDFEPAFHPWSSQYILANETYTYEEETIAVFNTGLLKEFFKKNNYNFKYEFSFEPRINASLIRLSKQKREKKKQILIYGRPTVERNGFPLIIEALRIWSKEFVDAGEWTIISAGEDHGCIKLSNGLEVKSSGKLSLEEYSTILAESFIGISLMISPHPSYPPLEMAYYDMLVLTNKFANKDLSLTHEKIHSISRVSPKNIASELGCLCGKYQLKKLDPNCIFPESGENFSQPQEGNFDFINDIYNILLQSESIKN